MKKIRKLCIRLAAILVGLVLALLLVEGLATAVAYYQHGTIDIGELHRLETGNTFVAEADEQGGYLASLMPHPYLAHVHNEKLGENDPLNRINNIGLKGRDFPLVKDPDLFTVLVTGGSVAQQLCSTGSGGVCHLEQILNERYAFEKRVVVLNGADGAWKQPQQAILCMLYADIADAVVSLDGYNEHHFFNGNGIRLEMPSSNFQHVNPILEHGHESLAAAWQSNQLKQFSKGVNSRVFYYVTRSIRQYMDNLVTQSEDYSMDAKKLFLMPPIWPKEKRIAFNTTLYQKYIHQMKLICDGLGIAHLAFIQPCPAIGKNLTSEELSVAGDLSYGEQYQTTTSQLLSMREEGVNLISLLDVLNGVEETCYRDGIHCSKSSPAYPLISAAMAEQIAVAAGVPPKK